jgi:hypothetical protein
MATVDWTQRCVRVAELARARQSEEIETLRDELAQLPWWRVRKYLQLRRRLAAEVWIEAHLTELLD